MAVEDVEDEASIAIEPLTSEVVANLEAMLARGHRSSTRFSRVGDSTTVSTSFAGCFAKDAVSAQAAARDLDDDVASLEATRQHFARP